MANVTRLLQPSVDPNVAHKYHLGLGLVSAECSRTEDYLNMEPSKTSNSLQSVRNSMLSNFKQHQQQNQQQLHQQFEASTTHQQDVYGRV